MKLSFISGSILAVAFVLDFSSAARAEVIVLDCQPETQNLCPSHWEIDTSSRTGSWYFCNPSGHKQAPSALSNFQVSNTKLTFDWNEISNRHHELDRKSGLFTITDGNEVSR